METSNQIKKKAQKIAKIERKLALEKIKERKAETRRKIEFGGLVVKAKMDQYSKDIILGALLHAAKELNQESGSALLYQSIGQSAFMEHGENGNVRHSDDPK